MSLLAIENLTKRYAKTIAVDTIDLEVPPGSRTAIVGPSGCGKTTLLRLIAGFDSPDRGRIVLGGTVLVDVGFAMPAHKRRIGYVAQEGALFPHLSVAANVGFGLPRRLPDRDRRIVELLAQVELPAAMVTRRPHELSGGQQQRVALARALAQRPRLMLLDEPFSALDTGLREAMRDMVGSVLSAAGITTILVTHDQAEALSFAEHLVVMRRGAVVQSGVPQDVYRRPRDAAAAVFLGEAIFLEVHLTSEGATTVFGAVETDATADGVLKAMLRPEQLVLSRPVSDHDANARVLSRSYRGPTCRVVVVPVSAPDEAIALFVSSHDAPEVGALLHLEIRGKVHAF